MFSEIIYIKGRRTSIELRGDFFNWRCIYGFFRFVRANEGC
jgi:hypothetical protein